MRLGLIVAIAVAVLAVPSAAVAATTFGSDLSAAAGAGPGCPSGAPRCTVVRTGPAGTVAAPASGVIVRWRVKAAAEGSFALRVLRPGTGDGSELTAVATSSYESLTPRTNVFAARVAVAAGDRIGIDGTGTPAAFGGPGTTALIGYGSGGQTFADGETRATGATGSADLLLNADIESDADGDGYGDETQDACPFDAQRQTACASDRSIAAAAPEFAVAGQAAVHEFTVRAARDGATGVVVSVTVPAHASMQAASAVGGPSAGTCTIAAGVARCVLGTVRAGQAATVAVQVTRSAPGVLMSTGRVEADGSDPAAANDTASATTRFTPPSTAPPPTTLPNPACAHTIRGTRDDDVLAGTEFGDRLLGEQGSDLLRGGGGDDCLEGGSSTDVLDGGAGNDRLLGGLGRDRVYGSAGNDVLAGGLGKDYVTGGSGDDVLNPGRDRDRAVGGPGNDTVNARDRTRDSVDCGSGLDTVRADRYDRVRGCERRAR